ncbi:hypothetical protein ACFHYQ_18425 [Sphaerimonospora cavernae]|uniref:Uncharacterized protein n=1 Tax=Sphaerimonospora cavernae TaxID=1740611 RepID=A0ABV6U739_9ACTN
MCLSCGCGEPDNDHGNPANITRQDLRLAAEAAEISSEQAVENIQTAAAETAV